MRFPSLVPGLLSTYKPFIDAQQTLITTSLEPDLPYVDEGSFVDIGVKQDGLLHRSQLKGRQLSVGQVIEVEILEVDEKRGRISLGLG